MRLETKKGCSESAPTWNRPRLLNRICPLLLLSCLSSFGPLWLALDLNFSYFCGVPLQSPFPQLVFWLQIHHHLSQLKLLLVVPKYSFSPQIGILLANRYSIAYCLYIELICAQFHSSRAFQRHPFWWVSILRRVKVVDDSPNHSVHFCLTQTAYLSKFYSLRSSQANCLLLANCLRQ